MYFTNKCNTRLSVVMQGKQLFCNLHEEYLRVVFHFYHMIIYNVRLKKKYQKYIDGKMFEANRFDLNIC